MKTASMLKAVLLLMLTSTLAVGQRADEQKGSTDEFLSRKVKWINPQRTDALSTLITELASLQLPGGILFVRNCGKAEPEIIAAESSTLGDELNRFLKVMPEYQWTIDDGVLNFLPKSYSPSPLDISLDEFKVENVTTSDAYNRLFAEEQVKNGLARLGLHEPDLQLVFGGSLSTANQRHITLNLRSVTLQEALNAIVRADGRKTWELSVNPCGAKATYQHTLMN
jgi:hypothetical protein